MLLLADLTEKFWNMCLEIYEINPACFLNAPGLAGQAASIKTKVNLDFLNDIDMLWMVGKCIIGGHAIHQYAKANNKYMEDYDKNKKSSDLQYYDLINLYRWTMSKKLS